MSRAIASTNKSLDDSMILGYLFFYTLGEISIRDTELAGIFQKHGIDQRYIRRISPVDAFRRATSDVKQTVMIDYNGQMKKAKVEIDEVAATADEVIRVVGRKVVDEKNEDLSYETLGKIIFDRKTESVTYRYDNYMHDQEYKYEDVFTQASLNFFNWTTFHTKDTIRNITSTILRDMYPVNLMPSGMCKFIPNSSKDLLYSLQKVVRELTDFGGECLFELVPVVDTDEMRDTIDKSAVNEIENEALLFIKEMKEAIDVKADLSTRAVASYIEKSKALESKVTEYESLLGTYMGYARAQVQEIYRMATENQKMVI